MRVAKTKLAAWIPEGVYFVHNPPVVGNPFEKVRSGLLFFRAFLYLAFSVVAAYRSRASRKTNALAGKSWQEFNVRLPDVRAVCPQLYRYVLPYELPEVDP